MNKEPEPLLKDLSKPGRRAIEIPSPEIGWPDLNECIPGEIQRQRPPLFPELTELQVVRHFTRLSQINYSIDTHFYPLGSCTMKYNPKINEVIADIPALCKIHPLTPDRSAQGTLQILYALEKTLCTLTGMAAFTLQPCAGAQGELTGLLIAKMYHKRREETLLIRSKTGRNKVLVPDSAHGTNPASAALAGFEVVQVRSNPKGRVDLEDLWKKLDDSCALVMLTVPNTLGLYENDVQEISHEVHMKGGLMYMDGANFNALAGHVQPKTLGFDILHLNLHKTFSTPHGGGGPGAGPVGVTHELEPFLPVPRITEEKERYMASYDFPKSIGRMASFHGNVGILLRAYAYARALGAEGLKSMSERAIINANYLRVKLDKLFKIVSDEPCMHEAVFSGTPALKNGVRTLDIAKRLLDYGFYAPTIYFPLIVPECMMIEPTESETRETMDAFVEAMEKIVKEIEVNPELVKTAPHTTAVKRLDEVRAAREPILKWPTS